MLETGVQPLFTSQEGLVYPKLARSPYVGKFVAVVNRDKKDFQARLTKGRYGYVKSVDVERSRARVSFENKEVTIALINLVLLCVYNLVFLYISFTYLVFVAMNKRGCKVLTLRYHWTLC